MKILLINQFFWPDLSATSQLLTDLARGLAERGHDVSSISAEGGYAIPETGSAPPVHMHYVKALPFVRGKLGRVLSYGSFYLAACWRSLTMPKVDVVVTLTTPPLLSLLGTAVSKLRGARHYIWEMDMYPDVAVDCDYLPAKGLIDRVTGFLADQSRKRADGVIALGECMQERLLARGTPAEKIAVAYTWADSRVIQATPFPQKDGKLTVLYSGNLGLAHDLDTITGAIHGLRDDGRFRFVFAGGGARRQALADLVQGDNLTSVEIRSYVEAARLSESLGAGDIGLVTQRDTCWGTVVPSKIYGLLAAGRPVLFIGPARALPARIIRRFNCGWHIPVGAVAELTALLRHLADNPEEVYEAGKHARQALLDHFDLPLGVARMAAILDAHSQHSSAQASLPAELHI